MRASIAEMIRRPVALGIALAIAFLIGVVVGAIGRPWMWRDVDIFVIGGTPEHGCRGFWGETPIRFGRVGGSSDGTYAIPCDELVLLSDYMGLRCECSPRP